MFHLERSAKDEFEGFNSYFLSKKIKFFTAQGSNHNGWGIPSTVLDYSLENQNDTEQWASAKNDAKIIFTAKCPIYLTHYRLRTRTIGIPHNLPLSWRVEGQTGAGSWSLIDTKTDRPELSSVGGNATFKCDTPLSTKVIKMTATKTTNNSYFHLSRVEFFGEMDLAKCPFLLKKYHICGSLCIKRRNNYNLFIVSCFMICS